VVIICFCCFFLNVLFSLMFYCLKDCFETFCHIICECHGFNKEWELYSRYRSSCVFFNLNSNPNESSPSVILPKFCSMRSFEASSNKNKVDSNLKLKHNNHGILLLCLNGLFTFIPPIAPNMCDIHICQIKETSHCRKNLKTL
jgi:hypothetical protein